MLSRTVLGLKELVKQQRDENICILNFSFKRVFIIEDHRFFWLLLCILLFVLLKKEIFHRNSFGKLLSVEKETDSHRIGLPRQKLKQYWTHSHESESMA
jgi:hypothetical protein